MRINPPYNNGVDAEIRETSLPHKMTPERFLIWSIPRTECAAPPAEVGPPPFSRGKDRYGMKGMPIKSSAPLLDRSEVRA